MAFGWDPNLKPYKQDLAAAKKLLAEAGYPNGVDIVFNEGPPVVEPAIQQTNDAIVADMHKGTMARGLPGRLGTTAVLDVNDIKVILISYRWQTLDPEMIRFVGLDPLEHKILVVKSTIHYRAAFEPIARGIIEVDAPGLSSSNLARFDFNRVRRPIFPLDPDTTYP